MHYEAMKRWNNKITGINYEGLLGISDGRSALITV